MDGDTPNAQAEMPPPTPYAGETQLSNWPHTKLTLGTPEQSPTWAPLTPFHAHGTLYLTSCRLIFVSHTYPHISIPLIWLIRERLHHRRPFFDTPHIAGALIPDTPLDPSSVFATGHVTDFRLEGLCPMRTDTLCAALRDLLEDETGVLRQARVLRRAMDSMLVPTGTHFAFYDPCRPTLLHLTTQLAHPPQIT